MPWGSARGPWRQRWRGRTKALRRSAAGDAHVAGDGRLLAAAVDDEVVALGLAADGLEDGGVEQVVALAEAQRRAQVGGVLLAEAHVERAGAGEAHAVAAFTEVVGQRRDEAEAAAGLLHAHIARRAAGAVVDLLQRPLLGELGAQHGERPVLVDPLLADLAHRHDLDEGEVVALVAAPGAQVIDLRPEEHTSEL